MCLYIVNNIHIPNISIKIFSSSHLHRIKNLPTIILTSRKRIIDPGKPQQDELYFDPDFVVDIIT